MMPSNEIPVRALDVTRTREPIQLNYPSEISLSDLRGSPEREAICSSWLDTFITTYIPSDNDPQVIVMDSLSSSNFILTTDMCKPKPKLKFRTVRLHKDN